jgi:glycosyltransferase involved in cell wall biosynthesis
VISPEAIVSVSERHVRLTTGEFDDEGIRVLQPPFLSFPHYQHGDRFSTKEWTVASYTRAVLSCIPKLRGPKPLACYGHFFYPSGYAATRLAETLGVPAFAAFGGSIHGDREVIPIPRRRRVLDLARFDGIVSVSETIRNFYLRHYDLTPEKIRVFQNAADTRVFYPRDKQEMRRRLGLPEDAFIVLYVGRFEPKKGSMRLHEAMKQVPEAKVIFLGKGEEDLSGPQTLKADSVPHQEVPEYLSAADVFALPTLFEGSSNAIQEALACGLPVVSANREFNTEFMRDGEMGLLVDPEDIDSIAEAIRRLYKDRELLTRQREAALRFSTHHNLENRAMNMLAWFEEISTRHMTTKVQLKGEN